MQKTLNLKVKFRESFRPFAPMGLLLRLLGNDLLNLRRDPDAQTYWHAAKDNREFERMF